jgi:hypothetical protein
LFHGIEKILVIVGKQMDYTNYTSAEVFVAGTKVTEENLWYNGCENQRLVTTTDLTIPVPNANFYIR